MKSYILPLGKPGHLVVVKLHWRDLKSGPNVAYLHRIFILPRFIFPPPPHPAPPVCNPVRHYAISLLNLQFPSAGRSVFRGSRGREGVNALNYDQSSESRAVRSKISYRLNVAGQYSE